MKITIILFFTILCTNLYSQQEIPFKKIRIQMPERTDTEHKLRDDKYFEFLPQYIGMKPNDLFEFDVSQLKLEKDTIYTCYMSFSVLYVFDKKITRSSYRSIFNEFEFTTANVVDGILQLPYNFCRADGFVITRNNMFLDFSITNKSENYKVFSRLGIQPELK